MSRSLDWFVPPVRAFAGEIRVPGDKSVSHRAVMLGAIANGPTEVTGFLEAGDTRATLRAVRDLGIAVESDGAGSLRIAGGGRDGLGRPAAPLDLGNSGTGLRLLAGLLAGQPFDSTLAGDESLSRRPMRRIAEPLAEMGAKIETAPGGTPPLAVRGGRRLAGIDHRPEVPSAQVKSCLLLAGLYARGRTRVEETAPTRDHTERMLAGFGYEVERSPGSVAVVGGGGLEGQTVSVPGDLSSAAFLLVGACIAPRGRVRIPGVGVNPTRDGVLRVLERMGARIRARKPSRLRRRAGRGPRRGRKPAQGSRDRRRSRRPRHRRDPGAAPRRGLRGGRHRVAGCRRASGQGERPPRGHGGRAPPSRRLRGATLRRDGRAGAPGPRFGARGSRVGGDHRIAMTFALAALGSQGAVEIEDCANVATSFPEFPSALRTAGVEVEVRG